MSFQDFQFRLVLDNSSFKAGSTIHIRLASEAQVATGLSVWASVYRAGNALPVVAVPCGLSELLSGFQPLWETDIDTPTGAYTIRAEVRETESDQILWKSDEIAFAVWKSAVRIESFQADRRFYAPGDPIQFKLTLVNEGSTPLKRLRVEIGAAQYPWITSPLGSSDKQTLLSTEKPVVYPGETATVTVPAVASCDGQGSTVQYTATVRAGHSAEIIAFRSTPTIFLRCPEHARGPIYPASYIHSDLSQVRTSGYRDFYPQLPARAIFDRSKTSFKADQINDVILNAPAQLPFRVELRTEQDELVDSVAINGQPSASLRFGPPGLYRLVAVSEEGSDVLEVSANVLPESLLIIGAHPDDEFLHPAVIRAAIENSVPVHIVYLTNGDAGGSDRFFGVEYSPNEAIEFGHIRMAEARAAAFHLGVPSDNLHFLGLPDGFLEAIRTASHSRSLVFSPLLGTDHSPYRDTVEPNLPFQRHAVLKTLAGLIAQIKPDTIYTSHPDERHADHKAAGLLTVEALLLLASSGRLETIPSIRTDQFYGASNDTPAPFVYEAHNLFASGEVMARVQEAYWFYQTQGGNHARGHMLTYSHLPRVEYHQELLNWFCASSSEAQLAG